MGNPAGSRSRTQGPAPGPVTSSLSRKERSGEVGPTCFTMTATVFSPTTKALAGMATVSVAFSADALAEAVCASPLATFALETSAPLSQMATPSS
jgi:hypothetical protein